MSAGTILLSDPASHHIMPWAGRGGERAGTAAPPQTEKLQGGHDLNRREKLLKSGILVRDYTGEAGLKGEFIRIAVGTMEQNKAVIQGITAALD